MGEKYKLHEKIEGELRGTGRGRSGQRSQVCRKETGRTLFSASGHGQEAANYSKVTGAH